MPAPIGADGAVTPGPGASGGPAVEAAVLQEIGPCRPDRQRRRRRHLGHAPPRRRRRAARWPPPACTTTPAPPISRRASGEAAPPESGAHGATSPLARLLRLQRGPSRRPPTRCTRPTGSPAASLGRMGVSDENNALKLGYDPVSRAWPAWLDELGVRRELLPEVVAARHADRQSPACRPRPAARLHGRRRHHRRLRLLPRHRCRRARRRRHRTGLHADAEAACRRPRSSPRPTASTATASATAGWSAAPRTAAATRPLRFFTPDRMAELTPRLRPEQPPAATGTRCPARASASRSPTRPRPSSPSRPARPTRRAVPGAARGHRPVEARPTPWLRARRAAVALACGRSAAVPPTRAGPRSALRLLRRADAAPASLEAAYGTALLARQGGAHG